MSKKRGLSLEDKRKVILSIYHDGKVPYNLKEIESTASRMGVVQQTIKDVNQSLVDDNLILSDKIGSANFYWSFPSKLYEDKRNQLEKLSNSVAVTEKDIIAIERRIEESRSFRINTSDRQSKLQRIEELKNEEVALDQRLSLQQDEDPEYLAGLKKQIEINKASVNRWTDNIYEIKNYLVKKRGIQGKESDKMLGIDANFDYLT